MFHAYLNYGFARKMLLQHHPILDVGRLGKDRILWSFLAPTNSKDMGIHWNHYDVSATLLVQEQAIGSVVGERRSKTIGLPCPVLGILFCTFSSYIFVFDMKHLRLHNSCKWGYTIDLCSEFGRHLDSIIGLPTSSDCVCESWGCLSSKTSEQGKTGLFLQAVHPEWRAHSSCRNTPALGHWFQYQI